MLKIREKKHRLERKLYKGELTVVFTLNIKNKKKILNNDLIFKTFEEILLDEIGYSSFVEQKNAAASPLTGELLKHNHKGCVYEIPVYLFMPDHIHLILRGIEPGSDVIKIINMFKQRTGFWFYKNMPDIMWQKDYYDHVIRNEKDIGHQVNYILYNPVRTGMVNNWKEYKYKGSTIYDFNKLEIAIT